MSTKRKSSNISTSKDKKHAGDSQNLLDSFKSILKGNKSNKLGRVTSHKMYGQSNEKNTSLKKRRSKSDPAILTIDIINSGFETHVADKRDSKISPKTSKYLEIDDINTELRYSSAENFFALGNVQRENLKCDILLAENCPPKAAKTLGIDEENLNKADNIADIRYRSNITLAESCPPKAAKKLGIDDKIPKKERNEFDNVPRIKSDIYLAEKCSRKAAKTLGLDEENPKTEKVNRRSRSNRSSFRLSLKTKDMEPLAQTSVEMDTTVELPEKAAKTLGVSSTRETKEAPLRPLKPPPTSCNSTNPSTEDFLRKIGALGKERGKPLPRVVRKLNTSPAILNKCIINQNTTNSINTNFLSTKPIQPNHDSTIKHETDTNLINIQSEKILIPRKRRNIKENDKTDLKSNKVFPKSNIDSNLLVEQHTNIQKTVYKESCLTLSRLLEPSKKYPEAKRTLISQHSSPEIHRLKDMKLNNQKLKTVYTTTNHPNKCNPQQPISLSKCSQNAASEHTVDKNNTIMMIPSHNLGDGEVTPAVMLTPAPTVVKLFRSKTSLSDVLKRERTSKSHVKAPS